MTTKADAWAALSEAMRTTPPACEGFDEFTADELSADELAWCASVCARCPLLALCGDYANAARPSAGYWAGRQSKGSTR